MIKDPLALIAVLITIEAIVLFVSSHPRTKHFFHFIPAVFWMFFLPLLCASFSLIDAKASIYQLIANWILPASLVLLLMSTDIRSILRLGKPALIMMIAGSTGVVIGMPVGFAVVKPFVGAEMWSGFGALAGSWTGGSANMIAVKEAISTPDHVFTPILIVDTIVPYSWMGVMIALSGMQKIVDRFLNADRKILDDLAAKAHARTIHPVRLDIKSSLGILLIAAMGSVLSTWISSFLPVIPSVISPFAWTIIVSSALGIALSFTPAEKLEWKGSAKIGYVLLYFVLTSIGAKANISSLNATFYLIGAGLIVLMIHVAILVLTARLIRAPMFLIAAASQANLGGVASAPVVAAVYQPGLASVGLLLAIFGNIVGTYLGIISAQLCRIFAG